MKITTSSGKKIGDLVKVKRPTHPRPLSQVYSIPCGGCDKVYIGETGRGFKEQRMGQHKAALRRHDTSNALVVHVDTDAHLPNWTQATIIRKGLAPRQRKVIEAALIRTTPHLNTSPGSHEMSKVVANLVTGIT